MDKIGIFRLQASTWASICRFEANHYRGSATMAPISAKVFVHSVYKQARLDNLVKRGHYDFALSLLHRVLTRMRVVLSIRLI